ncbi:MAG: hypothetical protein K9L89_02155 [Kiritimatiellales bacterium]|nr:hypothetical protein [Kiritimatiellales bacterium]
MVIRKKRFKGTGAGCLLVPLLLAGCSTTPRPPIDGRAVDLGSIILGVTSRSEVIEQLGSPSASFEQGGVLTYQLAYHPKFTKPYVVPRRPMWGWARVRYSLVLTFDDRGLLDECSFVEVKKE